MWGSQSLLVSGGQICSMESTIAYTFTSSHVATAQMSMEVRPVAGRNDQACESETANEKSFESWV